MKMTKKSIKSIKSKKSFHAVSLVAVMATLILVGYVAAVSRAATATINPLSGPGAGVCGTWVLQQIDSTKTVNYFKGTIDTALTTPQIRGLSLRAPWNSVDGEFSLFQQAYDLYGTKLQMVRIMAGRHTPTAVFSAGANSYNYVSGSTTYKVPLPFRSDGSAGNPQFEAAYRTEVAALASWSRSHGIKVMHLPWHGLEWSEINHSAAVLAAPGYSYSAWLQGHKNLVDIAMPYAGADLSIEFPFSGSSSAKIVDDLTNYIIGKPGHQYVFAQANGWDPAGDWGAPNAATESAKDAVMWGKNILRGEQARVAGDDNWDAAFPALYTNKASYVEIYAEAFRASSAHRTALLANIAAFDSTVCHPPISTDSSKGGGSSSSAAKPTPATATTQTTSPLADAADSPTSGTNSVSKLDAKKTAIGNNKLITIALSLIVVSILSVGGWYLWQRYAQHHRN